MVSDNSTVELLSSPEWIDGVREKLDELAGRDGTLDGGVIKEQLLLQAALAKVSIGLMEELPVVERPTRTREKKRDPVKGLQVIKATQRHTRAYSLGYHPNHGHDVVHSELLESGSFARVVEVKFETFAKRPFVPVVMGGLALQEHTDTLTHVGLEFNSHSPIEPHPLDFEPDHIYRTVNSDFSRGERFNHDHITGLAEGLHAVAVRSQQRPGETDLPEPKVFI